MKLRGSAMVTSLLILTTLLLLSSYYQQTYEQGMENNQLLIKYFVTH